MPSYRIERDGQSFDAPDFMTLRAWVEQGRVRASDKVWSQGWKESVSAYDVSGLREIFKSKGESPKTGDASRGQYVVDDGRGQFRLANFVDLQQQAARGRVRADDLVWSDGWEDWTLAYDVSGLREIFKKRNERPAAKPRKRMPPLPTSAPSGSSSSSGYGTSSQAPPRGGRSARNPRGKSSWISQVGDALKDINTMAKEGFEKMGLSQKGRYVGVAHPRRRVGTYQADPDQQSGSSARFIQRQQRSNSKSSTKVDWRKEPGRYRREQGPFSLVDLLSTEHLQSYLSLRRHRGIEIPVRKLMPQMVPTTMFQALVPDARRLGQRDPLVTDLVAQISSFLALPQDVEVYVSSEEAWEMSLVGSRRTQLALLLGEAWIEELSELALAGLLSQLLSQVYLQDVSLRTFAWLLWKPEDLPKLGIHAVPTVDMPLLLDCLMEADHLGDLVTLAILGDEGAVVDALEEITEVGDAPRELEDPKAIQSLPAYFESPTPALASRIPALQRFAVSRRFQELQRTSGQFANVRTSLPQIQRLAKMS
ncbi:MAG: DUF4339 domain-containing protein [Myxococcales bacterium]|nr:DUF4339 domain-containing protein [Myxococcales bacterium]MCB9641877.1 DUF4339 domain-containing protein [Myxococcales bacterium]